MEKLLDEKAVAKSEKETTQVSRQIASTPSVEDHGAAYVPAANALIPSKVYEGHFADAAFHSQNPIGQSAIINRDISESKGSNEALMSVYTNQSVKAMLDKGDTGAGNFILMSSPIEITETSEKKLLKRELQVDQLIIDELKANPDKLRSFFEEKKIEHIGLLTLKSSSNMEVNYMVRRDEVGKLVVIPVNIARKSRLDDLKRTLQVGL